MSPLAGQASRIDTLNTRFGVQGQPGSVEAAIETARTAYVTPLSGQTQRIDSLNTRLGVEGQPGSVEAKITTAQNAYVTPLSGQTQRIDALNTRFGVAGQPGSVEAAIETARTAYVTPLSGQTQRIDSLNTRLGVEGQPGSVEAKIVTAQNAYVTPLSGQTQRIDSLNTRLGVAGQPGSVEAKIVTAQNAYVTPLEAEAGRIDGILTRIGTAGQPGSMEAKIVAAQNAYITPLGVQAGRIDTVTARLNNGGDIYASISSQAGAIADLQGRTSAFWQVEAVAGGRAQLKVWADSVSGGGVDIVGDMRISGNLLVGGSVGTTQIGVNQVTVPVSAFSAPVLGLPDGQWITVQSASINSSGAPIFISCCHCMEAEQELDRDVDIRVLRDGVQIYIVEDLSFSAGGGFGGGGAADWIRQTLNLTDTPGAGAHTYQFQAKTNDGASCKNRSIFLLETKR